MNMKILVASSTGLTGKAVVKALAGKGAYVRGMLHLESRKDEMLSLGASETIVSSIESEVELREAMSGMDAVFYICPTAHPQEGDLGKLAIRIAKETGIKKFIYQSVHNSIEPDLPHHRQKLKVEQELLESDLNYVILRPTAFMQNLLPSIRKEDNVLLFSQRFFTDSDSTNRINLIDVDDYAEIAGEVSMGEGYDYGQFDLCGPQNLSAKDLLAVIRRVSGHEVVMQYMDDEAFIKMSRKNGIPETKIDTLVQMFRSYNHHGFKGNAVVATSILGRSPVDFQTFLKTSL